MAPEKKQDRLSLRQVGKTLIEAPVFLAGLSLLLFSEIGRLFTAPIKIFKKDFSWHKLHEDYEHSAELLKESRLVKNYTGRIPAWLPAMSITGLLGLVPVALLAKIAVPLALIPAAAKFMGGIPLVGPFIATPAAAFKTFIATGIVGKLSKVPLMAILTSCPQYKESWIHTHLNARAIKLGSDLMKWTKEKISPYTQSMGQYIRGTSVYRASKATKEGVAYLAAALGRPVKGLARLLARKKAPVTVEDNWKTSARAGLHTLLLYGTANALPLATYGAAIFAFETVKAGALAKLSALGVATAGGLATGSATALAITAAAFPAVAIAVGGAYLIAQRSRRRFADTTKDGKTTHRQDVVTAQGAHEGLLIGSLPVLAMTAEHALPGIVPPLFTTFALAATAVTSAAVMMRGGYRAIRDAYLHAPERPHAASAAAPAATLAAL